MALSDIAEFAGNKSACGAADPEEKPSACGSACGAADPEEKPSACGSACGAGDNQYNTPFYKNVLKAASTNGGCF